MTGSQFYSPLGSAPKPQVRLYSNDLRMFELRICSLYFCHLVEILSIAMFLQLCVYLIFAEEHQSQLVDCGGLPIMITFLTEDSSEEVRKAATFILHTCKKTSKCNLFNILFHLMKKYLGSLWFSFVSHCIRDFLLLSEQTFFLNTFTNML